MLWHKADGKNVNHKGKMTHGHRPALSCVGSSWVMVKISDYFHFACDSIERGRGAARIART